MNLFYLLNLLGTAFFALTGALSGIALRMDLLGVIIMAFFVGLGGGTIRNMCLDILPVWLQDVSYIWATVLPAMITFGVMYFFRQHGNRKIFSKKTLDMTRRFFLIFDAFGLGLFAITGTQMAYNLGISTVGSILMGMITAVGGGIVRDLFSNEIPLIFQREIYATAALIGSGVYIALIPHVAAPFNELISIAIVIAIRLISVYRNWNVPRVI